MIATTTRRGASPSCYIRRPRAGAELAAFGAGAPSGGAMSGGRVAIAAMAKVPVAGEVKTRLCPPLRAEEAARLARCFVQDRVEQLADLPACDRLVAYVPPERDAELRALVPGVRLVPQVGADLGMRMDRLLSDLLAEGYAGAVAVGTDTPTLPTAYLADACRALAAGAGGRRSGAGRGRGLLPHRARRAGP